jgi:SiaC family regulatory phosphoprotein
MELHIAKTNSTPLIHFDRQLRVLTMQGESYPENSFDFYAPVLAWLSESLPSLPGLRLDVAVSYMNSSSIKCMLDILDLLEASHKEGKAVSVVWIYDEDNPRALDLAEEFRSEVTLPFTTSAAT